MASATNIPDKILDKIMERLAKATERGRATGYFKASDALRNLRGGKVNQGGLGAGVAQELGSVAGGIQRFNQSNLGGAGVANLVGGVKSGLGAIGGAIGANPWVMLGKETIGLVERFREWGSSLHETNREFAEFSGSMARVIALSDVRNIQLKREQGERRAESAEHLAEARDRLNRALAPIEDKVANFWNKFWSLPARDLANLLGAPEEEAKPTAGGNRESQGHLWLYDIVEEDKMIQERRAKRLR